MSASAGRATGASAALGSTLADLTGVVHATQGTRPPPLVSSSFESYLAFSTDSRCPLY